MFNVHNATFNRTFKLKVPRFPQGPLEAFSRTYPLIKLNSLFRVHYVSKLKALDTSEKDRALADLDKEKTNNRELQLR